MSELIKFICSDIRFLMSNIIFLILLFLTFIMMIKAMTEHNTLQRLKSSWKSSISERTEKEELLRKLEGAQEKDSIFYRMDLMLNRSGIRRKYSSFSAEHLILLCVLSAMICGGLASAFLGIFKGIITGIFFGAVPAVIIIIKAASGYRKTEGQLIHFLNMVENYTRTEDNIITIFGKVYPYLQEPLKSAIEECYVEANNTGDISAAFRRLDVKIAHEKFSEILRNLELCSNYEANYEVVAATSRDIMINYAKSKKKVKTITQDAVLELVAMLVSMAVLVIIIDSFISGSLIDILLSSAVGMVIIGYLAVVTIYSVFSVLKLLHK